MADFTAHVSLDTDYLVHGLADSLTVDELVNFVQDLDSVVADLYFTKELYRVMREVLEDEGEELERDPVPTFKAGDRVHILVGSRRGETGTIAEAHGDGLLLVNFDDADLFSMYYEPDELERISEPVIRVGARVLVVRSGQYGAFVRALRDGETVIGEVTRVDLRVEDPTVTVRRGGIFQDVHPNDLEVIG